ncbi:peptidoglycan binding domain-containing protein, partial [Apiospora rasikravindrae]
KIMADINVLISNGTCYKSASEESHMDYIPCGNAASGQHYPCCSKGDMCMSSNACFNGEYERQHPEYQLHIRSQPLHYPSGFHSLTHGNRIDTKGDFRTTYLAGCTDKNYKAGACPNKGIYDKQEWVGLTNCKRGQGKRGQDVAWIGCEEDIEEPSVNYGNQSCACSPDRADLSALFMDGQMLTKHANLPRTLGGTINFADGYTPTAASSPTTQSSMVNSGDVTGTAIGTATPEATSGDPGAATPNSGGSGLSTGALAGISTGAGVGGIILIAFIFLMFRYRRLKTKKESGYQGLRPSPTGTSGASSPGRIDGNNYDDKVSPNSITSANAPAHNHSGDNNGVAHGFFKAELPAGSPNSIVPSIENTPSPPFTQQGQQPRTIQYEAYDPDRDRWVPPLSVISERSNEAMMNTPNPYISPQSTGETVAAHVTQHSQRSGGMEPIYEMQA